MTSSALEWVNRPLLNMLIKLEKRMSRTGLGWRLDIYTGDVQTMWLINEGSNRVLAFTMDDEPGWLRIHGFYPCASQMQHNQSIRQIAIQLNTPVDKISDILRYHF